MRRRVLIVTSTFAPAMMADMHRARMLAWELPAYGWDVEVLCPDATYQVPISVDKDSREFFSPGTPVHYAAQQYPALFRALGMRSIGWRAYWPIDRLARTLFRNRAFDLVYFSTTQFSLFTLGPRWRKAFGLPYVLDFHDPCYRETRTSGGTKPGLRRSAANAVSRIVERRAVADADGLICVSPRYLETLTRRYGSCQPSWSRADRHSVIPFGASERDLAESSRVRHGAVYPPGKRRIVYVGAGGPIMQRAFDVVCRALAQLLSDGSTMLRDVVIELYGTMLHWKPGDRRDLQDIAGVHGVEFMVREEPQRVSYRRSLELLHEADGVLILGVEDAGYMPSKLFTYALSGKPLLAALDVSCAAYEVFQRQRGLGHCIGFGKQAPTFERIAHTVEHFLEEVTAGVRHDRRHSIEPYHASAMAKRHAALFEACVGGGRS